MPPLEHCGRVVQTLGASLRRKKQGPHCFVPAAQRNLTAVTAPNVRPRTSRNQTSCLVCLSFFEAIGFFGISAEEHFEATHGLLSVFQPMA
jgi:hypothetical protein